MTGAAGEKGIMNRYQKIVLAGAFVNAVVLMLFPPFDVESLMRGTPVFDAFYPMWAAPPNRVINANLLYFALFSVLANAAVAFLLLVSGKDGLPRFSPRNVVVALAFVNMIAVFLFPPFEALSQAGRFGGSSFDGFYFMFAGQERRTVFLPLLYIEVLFVLLNACAYWLALGEHSAKKAVDESLNALFSEEERLRAQIDARVAAEAKAAGRKAVEQGRKGADPGRK